MDALLLEKRRLKTPWSIYALMVLAIMTLAATLELSMGRVALSTSGRLLWWVGDVNSPETSQQLLDWYSFTHVLHGVLLYGILRAVRRKHWAMGSSLVTAALLEASWEVLENTPFIIHRYREGTMALGYYGDSVLNSMSDVLCCLLGFLAARCLPVWVTILLFVGTEMTLAWAIRDNLTLNVIMLIHPMQWLKHWQMAG